MSLVSDNLIIALKNSDDIILKSGIYILDEPLYIDSPLSLKGEDETIIIGTFILNNKCNFSNLTFRSYDVRNDPLILVHSNFEIHFNNCTFCGSKGDGIYCVPSSSPCIYFNDCCFLFLKHALTLSSTKYINKLNNCLFIFVNAPIEIYDELNPLISFSCFYSSNLHFSYFYKIIPNLLSPSFMLLHIIKQAEKRCLDNNIIFWIDDLESILYKNSIEGGFFMATPLEILKIYNVNPKSLDLELNQEFNGTEVIQVFETSNPMTILPSTIVKSSLDPTNFVRTVMFSTTLLDPTKNYTLKLTKDLVVVSQPIIFTGFPPITDVNVETFGNCLIRFTFPYPVDNLTTSQLNTVTGFTELANLYFLYFGLDTNTSDTADNYWLGNIVLNPTRQSVFQSPDLRTLIVQYNNRPLPLGSHKVLVNYRKQQITSNMMKDFATPARFLPIIEKSFTLNTAYTATTPQSVDVVSRTELVVTFNNPVLIKPTNLSSLAIGGTTLTVDSVAWADNTFTKLRYVLNNSSALPIGDSVLTVKPIYDSFEYLTTAMNFNITVVAHPATIVDIKQVEYPTNPNTTEIDITFSSQMNFVNPGSATDKTYYDVFDLLGASLNIQNIVRVNDYVVRMTLDFLVAGAYKLTVAGVKDALGLSMPYTEKQFLIIDTTVPTIDEIIATNGGNKMVIKFNEAMTVTGEYSATLPTNYMISKTAGDFPLPDTAIGEGFNFNKWVRLTLPQGSSILPFIVDPDYLVHIGYPILRDVLYVTNISGNIYPLCKTRPITRLVPPLTIATGKMTVISDSELEYEYTGTNEFLGNISKDDFSVTLNANPLTILSATLTGKKILFTFASNTFDLTSTAIVLKTLNPTAPATLVTLDIFANPIVSNVQNTTVVNSLRPKLKGISLLSVVSNTASLALKFNAQMQIVDKSDFVVRLNGSTVLFNDTASISTVNTDTILLNVILPSPLLFTDTLSVSVEKSDALIRTVDINDNKIQRFLNSPVNKFTVKSISWTYSNPAKMVNDVLSIVFDGKVAPASLVPSWNGTTPVTLAADTMAIAQQSATSGIQTAAITFDNAVTANTLGSFRVYSPSASPFIASGTTLKNANAINVALSTNTDGNSVLTITLANENLAVSISAVTYALFVPYSYTMNADTTLYINTDYTPTTRPSL